MARQRECAYYLVDGYNVINAWPELMRLRGNLDEARDVLVHILTEYGAFENYEMTVVFDAFFTEDEEHAQQITERMKVIYTGAGETASVLRIRQCARGARCTSSPPTARSRASSSVRGHIASLLPSCAAL